MKNLLWLLILVFIQCSPNPTIEKEAIVPAAIEEQAIRNVMKAQETAWNAGDIHKFMEGYWHSDSLTFTGSRGITKGWQQTLDNYLKGYPDKTAMGQLHFDILKMERLAPTVYQMIGKFTLTRADDEPSGHFTLIWKKINGKWYISSDQTC